MFQRKVSIHRLLVSSLLAFVPLDPILAIEEPKFEVLQKFENIEIRKYAPFLVAETEIEGEFDEVGDEAFQILADYIFGENAENKKMEMTAPVNMTPILSEGESYSAYVSRVNSGTATLDSDHPYYFQFVMPATFTLETLPKPNDSKVVLKAIPAKYVAALRYTGSWGEDKYRKKEQELVEFLSSKGIKTLSAPIFARYNAPFVPSLLRRNEVLIELDPTCVDQVLEESSGAP